MKKLLLYLLFPLLAQGQIRLTSAAEISLITCGPSQEELYSAFGHSAIRVYDPKQGIDYVFNYGVFDFDQPNFYLNFTRGNLLYKLSLGHFPSFRASYISDNRFLQEQVLNLDSAQKQEYFNFLLWNARPENADYLYDYFYDNCATRIRDGLQRVFGEEVVIDSNYVKSGKSIRALCDDYLGEQPWGDLGIDICLGLPMDKKASAWEYMFLPDYLAKAFATARIRHLPEGELKPLVKEYRDIYRPQLDIQESEFFTPIISSALLLLVGLILTIVNYQNPHKIRIFDAFLFSILGLVGVLLCVLWFFTNHKAAADNLNILILLPIHLLMVYSILRGKWSNLSKGILRYMPYYFAVILAFWVWLPQDLHLAFMPIVSLVILRSWHLYYKGFNIKKPHQ